MNRFRDAVLGRWGQFVTSHPRAVVIVALVLAAAGILLAVTRLEFHGDRSDLVDPELSWNKRYAEYRAAFARWDDLIVCLEGAPDDDRIGRLRAASGGPPASFGPGHRCRRRFSTGEVGPRLFKAAPPEVFDEVLDDLTAARRIAQSANANTALASTLSAARADLADGTDVEMLEPLLAPFLMTLRGETPSFAGWRPADQWIPLRDQRHGGRLRTVLVSMETPGKGIDVVSRNLEWLRNEVGEEVTAGGLDLDWGVTGIPAIEADETRQSIEDSTLTTIVALAAVTLMMLIVFRGIVVPLLAVSSLLIGMACSFGWVVLAVGHLQLLSVVFTVILLGLGIDFALHLVARLELVRDEHASLGDAISRVFRGIGPGLVTGAVTTAAAFGITGFTKFKGMAEMGIIAAGGVLLCLIAVMSTFPAALALTGRWKSIIRSRSGGVEAPFGGPLFMPLVTHPRTTLTLGLILVVVMAAGILRLRYDPNILNLHPPGIESVDWEQRIVEESGSNVWSALVETTAEDAPDLVTRLREVPEVAEVSGMGLLLPPDRAERAERVAAVAATPAPPALSGEPAMLRQVLQRLSEGVRDIDPSMSDTIDDALRTAVSTDNATLTERFEGLEAAFEDFRGPLVAYLDEALAPEPPRAADLPEASRRSGPAATRGSCAWCPHRIARDARSCIPTASAPSVAAVRAVAPDVHGPPVQIYESSELIKTEYVKAACFAVAVILFILLLDFWSVANALCALVPVSIGFVGCFGSMGWLGVPLNFANIIVLPLIFGIGVDAGVHVVHRWIAEPHGRPRGLAGGTGRGITLTMITTMIGFGSMTLAQHRGIRSLGIVMVIGLAVTLFACYVVLPSILRLRSGGDVDLPTDGSEDHAAKDAGADDVAADVPPAVPADATSATRG